ncbi:hypothetical protein FPZ41_18550 [Streptomyces sp. K1PN6]|uniref:Uncharacterized protein n=1 Tax=Streptomyces acidicola TaxID=2596892 RepID=A0A5N8WSU2_9ACTN|nr:hypothetical protein [Streptomyces acidicola]
MSALALWPTRSPGPPDRKTAQGKHHTQAFLCLARRQGDVLFAMLRDGTFRAAGAAARRCASRPLASVEVSRPETGSAGPSAGDGREVRAP